MEVFPVEDLGILKIPSGLPLRIRVEGDVYFGPVNLINRNEIMPRLKLGRIISGLLEGYWYYGEDGRIKKAVVLDGEDMPSASQYLVVLVDLRRLSFPSICGIYQALTGNKAMRNCAHHLLFS